MSGGGGVPLSDRVNVENCRPDESIRDYCFPSTSEASLEIVPQSSRVTTNAARHVEMPEMSGGDYEPYSAYFPCIEKDCNYVGPNASALYKHCKRMNHARMEAPCHEECPLCSLRVRDVKALILHAEQQHQFRGEVKTVDFISFDAFKVWKEDVEKDTVTFFSIRSTKRRHDFEYLSYKCHRSGTARTKSTGARRTHTKIVNKSCTAFLKVKTDSLNKKIHVEYCSSHIGHAVQPQFLPLSSSDVEEIGRLLRCRFSVPRITRVLREAHQDRTERMYWCTAQDVRNVAHTLGVQPGKRHQNDLQSIALRVQEKDVNDGIRFFKSPDENSSEFCLIIITPTQLDWLKTFGNEGISMDDTHNTCRYSLKLLTIMAVDEVGRGLPIAYMLSSKMDTTAVSRIFEVVKNLWPEFCPRTLMTDDCNTFWKAYLEVFPENEVRTKKYLCAWHVLCAVYERLRVNFQKKDNVKHKELRAALRALFVEANKPRWKRLLCYFLTLLEKLKGHENTDLRHASEDFEKYFRQNYLTRKEEWAPFARRNSAMNTTMFNERFHRLLKYSYLNRTTNSRVDFLIQCLIDLVEDLKRAHEISDARSLTEGKTRVIENLKRHKKSLDNVFTLRRIAQDRWSIEFERTSYIITTSTCTCSPSRKISHCLLCGLCPYSTFCTCPDNLKSGISCKHLHYWQMQHDDSVCVEALPIATCSENAENIPPAVLIPEDEHMVDTVSVVINAETHVDIATRCKELKFELDGVLDLITIEAQKLESQGTEEAKTKLGQMLSKANELLHGCTGSYDFQRLPKRRDLRHPGRPRNTTKQLQKGNLQANIEYLMKRSRDRAAKLPPAFIVEDVDEDETIICGYCEETTPAGSNTAVNWIQCDCCRIWVHLDLQRQRMQKLWRRHPRDAGQ